jgi:hypothetical protein
MPTTTYDNNNENNYTFDPAKIEFVAGIEKLKAQSAPGEAYCYLTMDDNTSDLVFRDVSGNSRDGAFQGGYTSANKVPAKINNGLQGLSGSSGLVNLGNTDFNFERTDEFSIEFWIKLTSDAIQTIISKQNSVAPFNGYGVNVQTGLIRYVIRDLTDVIAVETVGTYNDDQYHHVVLTYNGNSQDTGMNIYVDNVLDRTVFVAGTLTGSIINSFNMQVSGRDGNNNCILDTTTIDEVVIYNRELTAAEVAFRWNNGNGTQELPGPGVSFPTDNPSSIPKTGFQATGLVDFDAIVTEPGSDTVTFTVVVDGIEKYWNGSAWIDSTGYPQSNQAAVIKANISSLALTGLSSINHRRYFHSDDGSTTPELDNTTFEYNIEPDQPIFTESIITGSVYDIGSNNPDITISIRPIRYLYGTNTIINNVSVDISYDGNTGNFEARIYIEDDIPDELIWKFGTKEVRTKYAAGNIKFSALERIYP